MFNSKKTISYTPHSKSETFRILAFWSIACLISAFLLTYISSVYLTIDLSYKIEKELQASKKDHQLYQEIEERYASKLESLREEGELTLGLTLPKTQIFIDRYSIVARTGL